MLKKAVKWFRENSLMLVVLGIALTLRLYGNGYGLPDEFNIDETHYVPHAIRFGTGDLNPHWFFYPPLYMYALFALYAGYFVIGRVSGVFGSTADFGMQYFLDPTMFYLLGRTLTALLGTATVWLVYKLGSRAYSKAAGVAAAIMLALCSLHSDNSHFITADVPIAFLMTLSLWYAWRYIESGRARNMLAAGVVTGLAMATKYTAVLAGPGCAIAAAVVFFNGLATGEKPDTASLEKTFPDSESAKGSLKLAACAIALLAAGAAAGFLAGCPWALLDRGPFLADVRATSANIQGPWLGHEGITNMWTHVIAVFLRQGMGLPMLMACLAGVALAAWRRRPADWLIAGFAIIYYVWVAHYKHYGFARYWVAVAPALCILGGRLAAEAAAALPVLKKRPLEAAGYVALALAAVSGLQAVRTADILASPDTRTFARRWFSYSVQPDARVAVELNGPILKGNKASYVDAGANAERFMPFRVEETMKFDVLNKGDRPWAKISLTNKKYLFAAMEKEPYKYYVFTPFSLAEYPLEFYVKERFEYLVTNSGVEDRYLAAPDRFPKAVAFYKRLESECPPRAGRQLCRLVETFEPAPGQIYGPTIKVYHLNLPPVNTAPARSPRTEAR